MSDSATCRIIGRGKTKHVTVKEFSHGEIRYKITVPAGLMVIKTPFKGGHIWFLDEFPDSLFIRQSKPDDVFRVNGGKPYLDSFAKHSAIHDGVEFTDDEVEPDEP